jgi:hypothetical protein
LNLKDNDVLGVLLPIKILKKVTRHGMRDNRKRKKKKIR